jgi:tripartite-type tricarboxylate transporter receptor subunit TctC
MAYDATRDPFRLGGGFDQPGRQVEVVVPDDTDDLLAYAKVLYIGTGGDVAIIPPLNADGAAVTFVNVPDGTILPISARRVLATGTTASDIVAVIR